MPTSLAIGRAEHHTALISSLVRLSLTALGVVFGDIGTSPLYAIWAALFPLQHRGTSWVGSLFGPVMLLYSCHAIPWIPPRITASRLEM
jgi:K+ transporter